jgi:TRAP-type mannitol/chloroaromatic compound transport system permease small subunit
LDLLLKVAHFIDALNERVGKVATFLVLLAALVSAGNAAARYALGMGSNAWLEIQWYMFSAIFLLGASHTLNKNEHVRVDILYGAVPQRAQTWIDLLGAIFFLMPAAVLLCWYSWGYFHVSYLQNEDSSNFGGLLRWPVKLLMPVGFGLLALQGVSEIIKRIGVLAGHDELVLRYEKPLQ